MSNLQEKTNLSVYELALVQNDLSKLNQQERLSLYNKTCESLGLNPLTLPFGYIEFRGGKLSLYAKKDCTDQLRKIHGVSVVISSKENIGDNFVVMAKAKDRDGREDEDMGSVSIKGLNGDFLGNAMMKAITKAKRRVTLSICGLGMLDETEIETIKDAKIEESKEPVKETKPPVPNYAPTNTPQDDVDSYKTRFSFGSFKEGLSFKQLGPKDTKALYNGIKSWKLKRLEEEKPIPPQCEEFLKIADMYFLKEGIN